jgi:hypothetical protein
VGNTTWEYEGSLDLTHPELLKSTIYDDFGAYKTSNGTYIGKTPWNNTSYCGASSDGSTIVLNYASRQTIRDDTFSYFASGAIVFKETTPGNWEFVQRIRISHPVLEFDVDESDDTFVAMSRDGNRIVTSQMFQNFTQSGTHGKLDIFDWDDTDQEYKFIKYIEPIQSYMSDLFGANFVLSDDGRYIFTIGSGFIEDDVPKYSMDFDEGYNFDAHMLYRFDCGLPGSQPEYTFKSPRYANWVTDINQAYATPVYTQSPYTHYFTPNDFRGYARQAMLAQVSTTPDYEYSSHIGHNSGKHYAELFFNIAKSDVETPGFRVGVSYVDYTLPYGLLAVENSLTYLGESEFHYMYDSRGELYTNGISTPTSDAPLTGTLGIAVDIDNRGMWISINGNWIQGDPSTGTDPLFTLTDVSALDMSDYIYIVTGEYSGTGVGPRQTRTIFRTNAAEFKYTPPTGFTGWDTTVSSREYDYPYLVKYDNPTHYWRMDSDDVISDQIGSNDLIAAGTSKPKHSLDFGFHKVGSLGCFGSNGSITLTNPITRTITEEFTLSAMVYLRPNTFDLSMKHPIFSSEFGDGGDEFEVYAEGDGIGQDVTFGIRTKFETNDITYTNFTSPGIDITMGYYRWFNITVMHEGDGIISLFIDGVDADRNKYVTSGYTSFRFALNPSSGEPEADFRLKYIGTDPNGGLLNGYITEVVYHDKALNETYDRNYQYSTSQVNIPQYYKIIHLAQLGGWNHDDSTFGMDYDWSGPALADECNTIMLYRTPADPVDILSDHDTITITDYDSKVTPIFHIVNSDHDELTITNYDSLVGPPVEDVYGPYSFPSSTTGDVTEFTWTDPLGTTATPGGANRRWKWDSNDTASSGVGPTSGQGGSPEGYVYTESSSPTVGGDEFFMEFNTTLDSTQYSDFYIEFYTNQRGNDNNATCQVQLNEGGAGWVDVGPEFGGPSDPDKVVTGGAQIWSYRNVDLSSANHVNTRVRIKVTLGTTGTIWNNDYGIDTITITGLAPR